MTKGENRNIRIRLRKKGWSFQEVEEFLRYVKTHNPTKAELAEFEEDDKLAFE